MDKLKSPKPPGAPVAAAKTSPTAAKSTPVVAPAPVKPPRLFRAVDWLTFLVTFVVVMGCYYYTLAPDLTLEDSGELAVASFYAGIPHPPGYPVWTLYTWAWTLLPISNVAWRVALGSAFAGAVASGLLGLLVSRGSSMMMEGIADLKAISRNWENAICVVSGLVAGLLLGFNGYMWSQSVIVEVYSLSVVSLMGVLLCLLRWIYAPNQRRYLYWACFLFGICFTNHQSLIVAAMGIVVAIAAADRKLGRATFLWIIVVYIAGVVLKQQHVIFTDTNPMIFNIFNVVGLLAIGAYIWFTINAEPEAEELIRDILLLVGGVLFLVGAVGPKKIFILPAIGALTGFGYFAWMKRKRGLEWGVGLIAGLLFGLGASFYLYMALAGMSTPPMQWGYPRTVEGFIHAFTRGQYEKTNPTNLFTLDGMEKYVAQLGMLVEGIVDEFNWAYMLIAIIPFLFFLRMQKRERSWVIGITAIYFCLGPLLLLLINPPPDRQARELIRVFFTASHVLIAMGVGYGLTMIAAEIATRYEQVRGYLVLGAVAALDFAVFSLITNAHTLLADYAAMETAQYYGLAKLCCWLLALIGGLIMRSTGQQDKLLTRGVPGLFIIASFGVTIASVMKEKLNFAGFSEITTAIARSFNPDQYAMPLFGGLILVGMALVFLATALFKRKGTPIALALALFALMPLHTFMSHWSDNEQRGHMFGYWFGHDMFTPPFKGPDGKFGNHNPDVRAQMMKDPEKARFIYPEMTRDAILYGGTDPGRFCPTYMVFAESFVPPECKKNTDPLFDRRDVYVITQNALADGTYLNYIRSHYNRSTQIDPPFFQALFDRESISDQSFSTNLAGRLAFRFLDKPLIALGKSIENRRRKEGVYPPVEMNIATPEDSQRCFQEYLADAQRRLEHDAKFPNEPRQIKPGEDVRIIENRVQVSGQIAVMAINGLITKVMFDKNPTNEFFVEESFPLDWMYPHLTPFGVIMKINRQKQPTLSEEVLQRDHEFWAQFSDRLIGNWITYDTSVREIVDFVEKVYLQRDYKGFKGDRKFVRDDQAQKAFSKLRSSIGGVYAWRLNPSTPVEFRPKTAEEFERIRKEADFTFRQAFAFCPYSPEAVFRYVQLLLQYNRVNDALLVAKTCLKLDPYNGQVIGLVQNLQEFENRAGASNQLEAEYRTNPANFQNALNLAATYLQTGRPDAGMAVLDGILNHPKADASAVRAVLQAYTALANTQKVGAVTQKLEAMFKANPKDFRAGVGLAEGFRVMQQPARATQILDAIMQDPGIKADTVLDVAQELVALSDWTRLEATLERLTKISPESAEAWYDLSALKANVGKNPEALAALTKSLSLKSKENLVEKARTDVRFNAIRALPEFQKLVPPK